MSGCGCAPATRTVSACSNALSLNRGDDVAVVAEDVPERAMSQIPARLLEGTPGLHDHWVALEWADAQGHMQSVMEVQERVGGAPPRPL